MIFNALKVIENFQATQKLFMILILQNNCRQLINYYTHMYCSLQNRIFEFFQMRVWGQPTWSISSVRNVLIACNAHTSSR